ncbi:MAG: multicopper oxidase domain-containing protein [Gammaproteobacteria bacterium]|nr:multicopper oxidase domain-containing protein [Gammaproteobacteria bacterium]
MNTLLKYGSFVSLLALLALPLAPVQAAVMVQCPGDNNGDADWDDVGDDPQPAGVKCEHVSGSDGYANMGDGRGMYMFGFGDLKGIPPQDAIDAGILHAANSAPTIVLEQDDELYLSLTNTGMIMRPDLFDTHTIHFHGFPEASAIFDGVPDTSIAVNGGATLTYYYNVVEEGTYVYHCHVEAAEHMQMGMQGNLYVHSRQDRCDVSADIDCPTNHYPGARYAYSDGDGSTQYDVEMPLMLTGFDSNFHDASRDTQPLPFANMKDDYHMFNGRGYPTTVQSNNFYNLVPGDAQIDDGTGPDRDGLSNSTLFHDLEEGGVYNSQPINSLVQREDGRPDGQVIEGEKLLLRITNISITKFHTITVLGLPMRVVGRGGRGLIDKYDTSSVNVGGGEAYDVIIDTAGVTPGTYYVYITELNELSNNQESFGGPMTTIEVIAPPA